MLSNGQCAQFACLWEVTARNPGNVHRFADFTYVTYVDYLLSAAVIAPSFDAAPQRGVGATILEAIRATRQVVSVNTNLGIVLLLAPLAAVPVTEDLRAGLSRILAGLSVADARHVYQAIRLAAPLGLGRVQEQDIHEEPTKTLLEVMQLAAERDFVARQFTQGFHEVFEVGLPALSQGLAQTASLENAIIRCHLTLLATCPDSLIARKRGLAEAEKASHQAERVLAADWPNKGHTEFRELDAWLRAEAGRNPGTTADLATACLFAALRQDMIKIPTKLPWSAGSMSYG